MPKQIRATVPVTIAAAAGDATAQKRFEMSAYTGEPMNIGGFDLPIVIDLSSVDVSQQRIPILYDHCPDVDYVVGQTDKIVCDGSKITASGVVNGVGDKADKVRGLAAGGYVWQASVGAEPTQINEIKPGETVTVNGRDYPGPCYVARGCVLREISFVVLGGDRKTSALVAKNKTAKPIKGQAMNFQDYLSSLGFADQSAVDPEQLNLLIEQYAKQYEGDTETEMETPTAAASDDPTMKEEEPPVPANAGANPLKVKASANTQALRNETADELQRVADIKRISASYGDVEMKVGDKAVSIAAHAIKSGWSKEKTELEAMRNKRAQETPNVLIRGEHSGETMKQALTSAIMLRAGLKLDSPAYSKIQVLPQWLRAGINDANKNRVFDLAHQFDDASLVEICAKCLELDGTLRAGERRNRRDMIRAAMSGSNFSSIFTTSVNASLLASYIEAEDSTAGWTSRTDVADFKQNDRIRVQAGENLSKRARGQEADHTVFGDQIESYSIAHYAKQFSVDLIDIINDSMGALSDSPQRLGLAAARLCPDLVYAILLANANLGATSRALFNSTDGNTTTGAMTSANLKSAIQSMLKQRENGVNLNIQATHLVVPPALEFDAYELLQSPTIVITGTTDSTRGTLNSLTRKPLQVACDSRLENGVTDPNTGTAYSGSATGWYLASTYANTIEVAYLRGTGRSPEVRSGNYDREGKFGMWFDVSHSIGAKALDWRGLWRRTG